MGGYGSGRSGGRATTDSGLTLSLPKLIRDGLFRPGCAWGGSIVWTSTRTGERVGSIGYQAQLGEEDGRVRLYYTTTRWGGERVASDYSVALTTTAQPFGGRRWWWICPRTGRRVLKLHLPSGALTFASRQAHRLAYKSQRETPYDRALRRAFRLRDRIGADGGIGDYVPKPRWMRMKTYDRKLEEIWQAEGVVDAHLAVFLGKLNRRLGR